ncbi:MutS-related protein [Sphingobacterium corticibacter]|uniref:MutS-related protein n=1 Tax=Sphingobacterium corticibacter TaxID=2171749 RepID=UPI001EF13338|nr:DNA mismatch repair protein MutS [Sphingobacterium corticibacter]
MSINFYQQNISQTKAEIALLDKQVNTFSLLRLAVIIGGGAALFVLFQSNNVTQVLLCTILVIVLFLYLVFRQARLERLRDEKKAFLQVNENEQQMMSGGRSLYSNGADYEDGKHPYSSDLDIFGPHSLFEKINRCATQDGRNALAQWLDSASDRQTIIDRQVAVQEFASDAPFNQQLQTKLLFNVKSNTNLRMYLAAYFEGKAMTFGNRFMQIYTVVAPILIVGGIGVSLFGYNVMSYVLMLAIAHLLWTLALGGRVSVFSNRIDKIGAIMMAYSGAIEAIEKRAFTAPLNQKLQERLRTENDAPLSQALHKLGKLIDKLDARNNMIVGALLNMFMLWDFRQVLAIMRWKNEYAEDTLQAFEVMASYEALISLGVLSYNHPDWQFPEVGTDAQQDRIEARDLAHPLIPATKSVANDYSAQDHRVALVTGSNMAGKSTFLRTVGINAVLAYAGSAVCTSYFKLPIYRLVTYMRIKDDLNESTSTFKAELDRMKFILGVVDVAKDSFFLIDEMLRGTNSVDKYLGSKAIIKKLLQMDGKGMVATHDLQLSQLADEYPQDLVNYHFDIQIQEGEMLFDYRLKSGECKIFNASMLLKGIGVEVDAQSGTAG